MPTSSLDGAKRNFVKVIKEVARKYGMNLGLIRDSTDSEVLTAYKAAARKAHPDKGGLREDMQKLTEAREQWDAARAASRSAGRPAADSRCHGGGAIQVQRISDAVTSQAKVSHSNKRRAPYRFQGAAGLLTYQGLRDVKHWHDLIAKFRLVKKEWRVWRWCATLEEAPTTKTLHVHLMVQLREAIDKPRDFFALDGIPPNVSSNDLLGGSLKGRFPQASVDRGMFYVWADKEGTARTAEGKECVEGNYGPCWEKGYLETYMVKGKWPEDLWKQRKLSHETYDKYLFLCRDGVVSRKRNMDAVTAREQGLAEKAEMAVVSKRIRDNTQVFTPFPRVPEAEAWLQLLKVDRLRYPILIALGQSLSGKTEWVKDLLHYALELKIGTLEDFPDSLRTFDRKSHGGGRLIAFAYLQQTTHHQPQPQHHHHHKPPTPPPPTTTNTTTTTNHQHHHHHKPPTPPPPQTTNNTATATATTTNTIDLRARGVRARQGRNNNRDGWSCLS